MHPIILTLVTYLPLLGGLAILLAKGAPETADRTGRWIALWTSLAVLALSVVMWTGFDPQIPGAQYETQLAWMPNFGISYHTGVDGVSLVFVLLTAFLTPLSIGAGWRSVQGRACDFMAAVMFLETALMGLFSALDLVVFYMFYEATLIPASLMIGVWGGPKRIWASLQFFLFTFGGSLFMLVALVAMWNMAGTTDIPALMQGHFSLSVQCWLLMAFVIAFGVKLPLFPLHAWLPNAYTEAPTPTTALLSGVLSKTGAYGLLRFGVLMFPEAVHRFASYILPLGVIAIIYAAFIAFAQKDMKKVIAYSFFSHMGMIAVGLFTLNAEGVDGAIYQMLSHGVVIAALFFCVAAIAWRAETRDISALGGVAFRMPALASLAMLFTMANVGLPGTGSFVGELLVLMGAIHVSFWLALLAGTTMIMGAVYMLALYRDVIFGSVKGTVSLLRDLTPAEMMVLVPLAVVTLWMGVHPASFTSLFDPVIVHALGAPNQEAMAHTAHQVIAAR